MATAVATARATPATSPTVRPGGWAGWERSPERAGQGRLEAAGLLLPEGLAAAPALPRLSRREREVPEPPGSGLADVPGQPKGISRARQPRARGTARGVGVGLGLGGKPHLVARL